MTAQRDAIAAQRFLTKALKHGHLDVVRVINTDKAKAYPKAIEELSESGLLPEFAPIESPFLQQVLLTDGEDSFLSLLSQQPQEPLPCLNK